MKNVLAFLLGATATVFAIKLVTKPREYDGVYDELYDFDFEFDEEGDIMSPRRTVETAQQKADKERKQTIRALKVEQDYHLATVQYAIYETQEPDVVTEAKARLIEIHQELEALK